MKALLAALLVSGCVALAAAQTAQKQTFTGVITDDMCAKSGHAQMRMGPTDAECAAACVDAHGAMWVLSGKDTYVLSDQETASKFAARKVDVVGTLDARTRTIRVESIREAQ